MPSFKLLTQFVTFFCIFNFFYSIRIIWYLTTPFVRTFVLVVFFHSFSCVCLCASYYYRLQNNNTNTNKGERTTNHKWKCLLQAKQRQQLQRLCRHHRHHHRHNGRRQHRLNHQISTPKMNRTKSWPVWVRNEMPAGRRCCFTFISIYLACTGSWCSLQMLT